MKYFFWHVSTLFKELRLVVGIQTNHTFTSLDSIERFFSYKGFSSLSPWFFIRGGECRRPPILRIVQEYFWRSWQGQTQNVWQGQTVESGLRCWAQHLIGIFMRWQSHRIITTSLPGCKTAFLCRCLVLDRPNTSDLMVISMDLVSLGWASSLSV